MFTWLNLQSFRFLQMSYKGLCDFDIGTVAISKDHTCNDVNEWQIACFTTFRHTSNPQRNLTVLTVIRCIFTCIYHFGEFTSAEISLNTLLAECVMAEITAEEISSIATPAALLIHSLTVLCNLIACVERVASL